MKEEYPLEELFTIKIRRFETAIKVLEEKKRLYLKEVEILRKVEEERDEVLKHKNDKLKQLRESLDTGERTDKIQEKKRYLEIVKDKLLEKEKKVQKQK